MIWFILFGLVLVGILFIFLEITVIPGVGIAGILGGLSLLASYSYAFYQAIFAKSIEITQAFAFVSVSLTLAIAVLFMAIKMFPHTKMGKSMILSEEQREEDGYTAVSEELQMFLGEVGEAVTDLRPAGYAKINGKKVDVVARGEYLKAGDKLKVVAIEGADIIVEKAEDKEIVDKNENEKSKNDGNNIELENTQQMEAGN